MKKIIIGICLVIIVASVGGNWFASKQSKIVFEHSIDKANAELSRTLPMLKMSILSYEKGFRSSSAVTAVELDGKLLDMEEPLKMAFNNDIYHGPIMFTADGIKIGLSYVISTLDQQDLSEKVVMVLDEIFKGKVPVTSTTLVSFGENITNEIEIPALHFDSKTNSLAQQSNNGSDLVVDFSGLTSFLNSNKSGTAFDGGFSLGSINMKVVDASGKTVDLKMSPSKLNIDIDELYQGSILEGNAEMSIPEVTVSQGGAQKVSLSNISTRSAAKVDAEEIKLLFSVDVANIAVNLPAGLPVVPDLEMHSMFNLNGIQMADWKAVLDAEGALGRAQMQLLQSSQTEPDNKQMETAMLDYFRALGGALKKGVESNSVIQLSNDKGESSINFALSYVGEKNATEQITAADLLSAFSGKLHVKVNKAMIAGTPLEQLIDLPVSMGFATNEAAAYQATAVLENSELNVNGNPLPLKQMLGSNANQPLPWH